MAFVLLETKYCSLYHTVLYDAFKHTNKQRNDFQTEPRSENFEHFEGNNHDYSMLIKKAKVTRQMSTGYSKTMGYLCICNVFIKIDIT